YEPEVGEPVDARFAPKQTKPHAHQVLQTILVRVSPSILSWPGQQERFRGNREVTALTVYRGAFALPQKRKALFDDGDDKIGDEAYDADREGLTLQSIEQVEKVVFAGERGELSKSDLFKNETYGNRPRFKDAQQ